LAARSRERLSDDPPDPRTAKLSGKHARPANARFRRVTHPFRKLHRNAHLSVPAAAATVALAVAGCGGSSSSSSVSPAAYVKSVCGAAATWFHTIQTVGTKLNATVHAQGSVSQTKTAYVSFVEGILHATQHAESQLKAAGTPSVKNGTQISDALVRAFADASQGLSTAASHANQIPTTSKSAFQTSGSRVQGEVQQAIARISQVAPQKNPQLRAAAQKDPTCQQLKSLG
jgi:hypothetical protein